jgi:hypothetical protein
MTTDKSKDPPVFQSFPPFLRHHARDTSRACVFSATLRGNHNLNSDSVLKIIVEDFEKIYEFLETLYINGRLQLPLKGTVLIGY